MGLIIPLNKLKNVVSKKYVNRRTMKITMKFSENFGTVIIAYGVNKNSLKIKKKIT